MILSPVAMAWGFFLSVHAYLSCMPSGRNQLVRGEDEDEGLLARLMPGRRQDRRPAQEVDERGGRVADSPASGREGRPRQTPSASNLERCFQGPGYKLPE